MNLVRVIGAVVDHVETRGVDGRIVAVYRLAMADGVVLPVALPADEPWVEHLPRGARLRISGRIAQAEWWGTHIAAETVRRVDRLPRLSDVARGELAAWAIVPLAVAAVAALEGLLR